MTEKENEAHNTQDQGRGGGRAHESRNKVTKRTKELSDTKPSKQ